MVKKQKIEGVDPVVVPDDESDSESDLEPRPGLENHSTDDDQEDQEAYAKKWREQTCWIAEEALKYYNDTHQGVEYVFVDSIHIKNVVTRRAILSHSLFTAKKVAPSSTSPVESSPPTPAAEELFFAETAMYSGQGMKLIVHSCVIIDPTGPVPPNIGCFYCSKCPKEPFYHPPEEQLEFGKRDCDKALKYNEDKWTSSSDEEPVVPR